MLYPTTFADVLAFHVSVTLCAGGGVPEPVSDWLGEFDALLIQVTVADVLPDADGVKFRL